MARHAMGNRLPDARWRAERRPMWQLRPGRAESVSLASIPAVEFIFASFRGGGDGGQNRLNELIDKGGDLSLLEPARRRLLAIPARESMQEHVRQEIPIQVNGGTLVARIFHVVRQEPQKVLGSYLAPIGSDIREGRRRRLDEARNLHIFRPLEHPLQGACAGPKARRELGGRGIGNRTVQIGPAVTPLLQDGAEQRLLAGV